MAGTRYDSPSLPTFDFQWVGCIHRSHPIHRICIVSADLAGDSLTASGGVAFPSGSETIHKLVHGGKQNGCSRVEYISY